MAGQRSVLLMISAISAIHGRIMLYPSTQAMRCVLRTCHCNWMVYTLDNGDATTDGASMSWACVIDIAIEFTRMRSL